MDNMPRDGTLQDASTALEVGGVAGIDDEGPREHALDSL